MSATLQFPPLRIHLLGDPRLREKCVPVPIIGDDAETRVTAGLSVLREVFARMIAYCAGDHTEKGRRALGLAAPQIGIGERFFVFLTKDLAHGTAVYRAAVNPEVLSTGDEPEPMRAAYLEGCESIPGFEATVFRPERVVVRFIDGFTGETVRLTLEGLDARVFQHEFDHLDGVLITDRCSKNDLRRGAFYIKRVEAAAKKAARKFA